MNISIATINVNGLRNSKKRYNIFNWLSKLNFDLLCLQETHCTKKENEIWSSEWKRFGGKYSFWNNGENDSRGVAIIATDKFKYDLIKTNEENNGRLMVCSFTADTNTYDVVNIYAPNIPNDRILFFTNLHNQLKTSQFQNVILVGDFNCCLNSKLDR